MTSEPDKNQWAQHIFSNYKVMIFEVEYLETGAAHCVWIPICVALELGIIETESKGETLH